MRFASALITALMVGGVSAQETPFSGVLNKGEVYKVRALRHRSAVSTLSLLNLSDRPKIVLIGYWPPTNEMVREFSTSLDQNPSGWKGENWRGLGYDVYSFFPEFPNGLGKGEGDFEVDYQDTTQDFWDVVRILDPETVISFGRAGQDKEFEIETNFRNSKWWIPDYQEPFDPTPSPPDASVEGDGMRKGLLPGVAIVSAIQEAELDLDPYVDSNGFAGYFLCEFLGYNLSWYRDIHPNHARFATHIHIGSQSRIEDLKESVYITLETVIKSK